MKKIFSLVLALVMLAGLATVSVAAANDVEVNLRMNGFPEGGFIRIEGDTATDSLSVPSVSAGQTVEINAGYWHGILFSGISIVEKDTDIVLYRSVGERPVRNNANTANLPAYAATGIRAGHFGFVEGDGKPELRFEYLWRHNQNEPTAVHARFEMPADITVPVDIIAHWTPNFGNTDGSGFLSVANGSDTAIFSVGGIPIFSVFIRYNADYNGNGFFSVSDGVNIALSSVGGIPMEAPGSSWHNRFNGTGGWFNYHNTYDSHLRID